MIGKREEYLGEYLLTQKTPDIEEGYFALSRIQRPYSTKNFPNYQKTYWDHAIKLTPVQPIDCKVYPLSPKEQPALKEFIEEI